MIRGLHGLFYSSDAEATRAFLRDQLQLPHTDVGGGWLIFDLPEADVGVHPLDAEGRPPAGTHDVSFYCDDIHGTVEQLAARGVTFDRPVEDHGYGFVTYLTLPGGVRVQLYEPKYTKARAKPAKKKAATKKAGKTAKKAATKKAGGTAKKAATKKAGKAKKAATKKAGKAKKAATEKTGKTAKKKA